MKITASILGFVMTLLPAVALCASPQIPPFVPDYFAPAFDIGGRQLIRTRRHEEQGRLIYAYRDTDQAIKLTIERLDCSLISCETNCLRILNALDNEMGLRSGDFRLITALQANGVIKAGLTRKSVLVFRLPGALEAWTYRVSADVALDPDSLFQAFEALIDRRRYDDARRRGNVSMGRWSPEIRAHAERLLERGETEAGLKVLKALLATSPYDYEAHVALIRAAPRSEAAHESARIVLTDAEDPYLLEQAAHLLDAPVPTLDSVPSLEPGETGLQLILVPLPPCNPWLLEEAAEVYRRITGIPIKIRRLQELWLLWAPDRVAGQREIQRALSQIRGTDIDFTDWTKTRYLDELQSAADSARAVARYHLRQAAEMIKAGPGQYRIDPYLQWFYTTLAPLRSRDSRTMYVGITEANFYAGDANYIFSQTYLSPGLEAGLLSYGPLRLDVVNESFASRRRLTERIAKELVPASLKVLRIPRPSDPFDPYSYADSVARVDQKELRLSPPVAAAIAALRTQGDESETK